MSVTIARHGSPAGQITLVYEFFDARVLGHLWFIAMSDGASVQLLAPTFASEPAARLFERCVLEHPAGALLSTDSQLELARRVERHLSGAGPFADLSFERLCASLEEQLHER